MKKLWIVTLALLVLLGGCGAAAEPQQAPAPAATAAPVQQSAGTRVISDAPGTAASAQQAAPDAAAAEAPAEENAAEAPVDERMQKALDCVGSTTDKLYAAIGYPESSDYASSCLGSGDDGNLYYDGFTVYTYRENGVETVRHVE